MPDIEIVNQIEQFKKNFNFPGSQLNTILHEKHDSIKLQMLLNVVASLEKSIIQHGECFKERHDDALQIGEHADEDESLRNFFDWRRAINKKVNTLEYKMEEFQNV